MFILGLREEIVGNAMNICYQNYLEKQAISFTIHCAYLAWLKALGVSVQFFFFLKFSVEGSC